MRSLNRLRASWSVAAAWGVLAPGQPALADDLPPRPPAALREESPYGPAGALEVGAGAVWPSVAAPLAVVHGRLGGSYSASSIFTFTGGFESGVGLALSGSSPVYGYMLRLPLRGYSEVIVSRHLDYRTNRFANLHFGGSIGSDFVLSSQCANGSCSYLPPGNYFGFGFQAGISMTQNSSGLGGFVRWDADTGGCSGGIVNLSKCNSFINMFTWNVGWTFF